tara:strand:- start:70 stop:1308 length:1239 start_codon:yes stop_codon:yes gene_type:complete
MNLFNNQYLKNSETVTIVFLILLSIFIRIPAVLLFGDKTLEYEWEVLVSNLISHNILAFDYNNPSFNKYLFPNLLMPPLYAYYLYFLSIFGFQEQNYIFLVLCSQIFLASISVAVFYKINKIFFSKKICFYSTILFSIFPLHLIACTQISSINLQIFFTLLFFYLFFKFKEKRDFLSIFFLSLTAGLLILLRGEFIAILLLSILYLFFFYKVKIEKILLIVLITLLTVSPYLVRNIFIFNEIVITKSVGYNLWKGNNPNTKVEGGGILDKDLKSKINNIPKDKLYGLNFDKVFTERALKNLKEEPAKYFILFIKKILSYLFIDIESTQKNYYHFLHYIPVFLVGATSLAGIILSNKNSKKLNFLILVFFLNVVIFSIFFILPRYKLAILPLQIIFTNIFINHVIKKFFHENK